MFTELSHEDAEKSSVRRRSEEIVLAYNTSPKQEDRMQEGGGDPYMTTAEMKNEEQIDPERFSELLCKWQLEKGRKGLPWFTADPYRRWLSEIMLQQTQVSVVMDYFRRFLEAFPTVEVLADASEEAVMSQWAGLGYYSRARNLHKAAQMVVRFGRFPESAREWEQLPGVGKSTAAALASFCCNEVAAVCDGNVKRVLSRVHAIDEPIDQAKTGRRLQAEADRLVSHKTPGIYNQAMMDLGAMICSKHSPKCEQCPVQCFCRAHAQGNPQDYPRKLAAKPKKFAQVHALLCVERMGADFCVWFVRRDVVKRGMGHWKGLWALPEIDKAPGREVARIEHVMSHVTLELVVHRAQREELPEEAFRVPVAQIQDAPLPAPLKKLLSTLLFENQFF